MKQDMEQSLKQNSNFWSSSVDFVTRWGIVIAIVFLTAIFTAMMPQFLSSANIISIFQSISIVTVIAIGLTISLSTDGFDLSVGSAATLASSLVVSMFVWYNMPTSVSIAAAILITLLIAAINEYHIVCVKFPDVFAKISTMIIFVGVEMTYIGGGSFSEGMTRLDGTPTTGKLSDTFLSLGQAPMIIIIMLVVDIFAPIFLSYTK